jgi:hypothetical protein
MSNPVSSIFELDPNSFQQELRPGSRTLLVGFSGLQTKKRRLTFHWRGAFNGAAGNKLYVRDVRQMFYQRGIPGVGKDPKTIGRFLREYMVHGGFERSAFFGYSSWGHAALLFGWAMGADEVHAFSPRTRLPTRSRLRLLRFIPSRNWGLLKANLHLYFNPRLDRSYFDLRPILAEDNGRTRYHIYYGTQERIDRVNAERLGDRPGVVLHPVDTNDHFLATRMRDNGELAAIIDRFCRTAIKD